MEDDGLNRDGCLRITAESPTRTRVDFQPSVADWRYAAPDWEGALPWKQLALFDKSTSTIHTYPTRTSPSFSLLSPKYAPLVEIAFEGFSIYLPATPDDVETALGCLPDQFYQHPILGLGIKAQYRTLVGTLRRNNIQRLVITRSRGTSLDSHTLVLAEREFTSVAHELDRIAARFSDQSRAERSRHTNNELLWRIAPGRFPRDDRPYRKGVLVSILRGARKAGAGLSAPDRKVLVEQASREAPDIARRNPRQLYQLQRDFELAGLNEIIRRFETDLESGLPESHWQGLLKLNPFILSMLFGYPIVVVRDQAHLGGAGLDGAGDTIVDFLVSNKSTQSLALVEIKRPDTKLLGREFRAGRFTPSGDLNGAIVQVIDQRYELLVNYKHLAQGVGTAHAVDCVVVAGRRPVDADSLASFEMYRAALKDVRVFTFDEVLMKLQSLRDYLTPPTEPEKPALDLSQVPF